MFLPLNSFSQEPVPVKRSENKVIVEGKVYYIHVVKPGQTLYSISRAYNITEKEIAIENPGVYTNLTIGQVLKIPSSRGIVQATQNNIPDSVKYIRHTLEPKENIYALARKYNVSVKEIEAANPALDYDKLNIGQVVLIPRANVVYRYNDFILHKIRRKETLYGLAREYNVGVEDFYALNPDLQFEGFKTGKLIRIPKMVSPYPPDTIRTDTLPLENEVDSIPFMSVADYSDSLINLEGRNIKVAYLIPFNYKGQVEHEIPNEEDHEISGPEPTINDSDLPRSVNLLEFFEGSLMAVDSLKKEGLSLDIRYFDTQKSPDRTREILRSDFFNDVDLIFGPFYSWNVEIVNDFSRKNHIPMVSPFYADEKLTMNNPYLFQMNPSTHTSFKMASDYLAKDYDKCFVFIHSADSSLKAEVDVFKSYLVNAMSRFTFPENIIIKEINYNNAAKANLASDLQLTLSKNKKNIIIIPEDDEAFVSTVISQLYFQLKNFDIEVFGTPYFSSFQNIDFKYFHELGLEYLSPYNFSYNDPRVKAFLPKYVSAFYSEPSIKSKKGCMYAFLGYDLSLYFLRLLPAWQSRFVEHLNDNSSSNLMSDFRFVRPGPFSGFENEGLELIKYQPDFSIEVKKSVPDPENYFLAPLK